MKSITIKFKDTPELQFKIRRFTDLIRLFSYKDLLQHYKTSPENTKIALKAESYKDPTKLITSTLQNNSQSSLSDRLAIDQILKHIQQLLASKHIIAVIETPVSPQLVYKPFLPFINKIFCKKKLPIPIQLIFNIEILFSSYKAYT